MTIQAVKKFYEFTFSDEMARAEMMKAANIDEFVDIAVRVGGENRFEFSKDDMRKTMSDIGGEMVFNGFEYSNLWVKKIMIFGWVPLGYTR